MTFIRPCLPTDAKTPRSGPEWLHEVKHDGYRIMARRDDRVRLYTRRGFDWAKRYPRIVKAMQSLKIASAAIDGEAVWLRPDGVADFDKLHSRAYDHQVVMVAFDLLELDGVDYRGRPLEERKARLKAVLGDSRHAQYSEHSEGDGQQAFGLACSRGLEGIVSKKRNSIYISVRTKSWIKVRNPDSAAMRRYADGTW